jgi:hypothetical protein
MSDKINSFCSLGTEDLYANNQWWLNLYTIDEDGERDYHMLEFGSREDMIRFQRLINNIHYSETFETDIIYLGAYGPILETEEIKDAE